LNWQAEQNNTYQHYQFLMNKSDVFFDRSSDLFLGGVEGFFLPIIEGLVSLQLSSSLDVWELIKNQFGNVNQVFTDSLDLNLKLI